MGFCNWRKAKQCFLKHETSLGHCEAILKVNNTEDISELNATHRGKKNRAYKAAFITMLPFAAGINCKKTQGHK